jgi:hypothetical protein
MATRPLVQVTSFSVSPSTITSAQGATLTVGITNNDNAKGHSVRLLFSSHALVSFYIGDQPIQRSGSDWELTVSMLASESRTQVLTVKAGLESGVSQITYKISMTTFVDGAQSESKSLDLTVRAP